MANTTRVTALIALLCGAACNNPQASAPRAPSFVDDSDPERTRVATTKTTSAPLVVDWQPEYRADLEVLSKNGVAVVRFTDKAMELLGGCRAKGNYDYVGVNPKTQSIIIKSRAELQANVPLGAFKLESKLASHGALTVDLRLVGKRTLDRGSMRREDLEGDCAKATHFVSALTVGAFRFAAGAGNEGAATVGALGAGGGAAASASREMLSTDGDFGACDAANPEDAKAPPKCSAVLRIQLVPLDLGGPLKDTAECGGDLRWNGVSCVSPKTATASGGGPKGFVCKEGDAAECSTQCDFGNQASCTRLGRIKHAAGDLAKAERLYRGACGADWLEGCGRLSTLLAKQTRFDESRAVAEKACSGGEMHGCTTLAVLYDQGWGVPKDKARSYQLADRGCKLKDYVSCTNAASILTYGAPGVPADPVRARALFQAACDAEVPNGCLSLAAMYFAGLGGPKDATTSYELKVRACDKLKSTIACVHIGRDADYKKSADPEAGKKALVWFDKACAMEPMGGCSTSEESRTHFPSEGAEQIDRMSCDGGTDQALACYNAGFLWEHGRTGTTDLTKAAIYYEKACKQGAMKKACGRPSPVIASAPPPVAPAPTGSPPAVPFTITIPSGLPGLPPGWSMPIPGIPLGAP